MNLLPLRSWSGIPQLVFHQAAWWACVLWKGWWGPVLMLLFVLIHLGIMRSQWRGELRLILLSTLVGIGLDNALAAAGAVTYVGEIVVGGVPLWLVSIWMGFGATLRHSQAVLVRSLPIALLTGSVGGPLAYFGGQRLGCLVVTGMWGGLAISVLWTIALVILYWAVVATPRPDPTA